MKAIIIHPNHFEIKVQIISIIDGYELPAITIERTFPSDNVAEKFINSAICKRLIKIAENL